MAPGKYIDVEDPLKSTRSNLRQKLQEVVKSIEWTYSIYWKHCPSQGLVVWSDGYYNGDIKTKKTVQEMKGSWVEQSIQRSVELRELYEYLSAGGESSQVARRLTAALSPEDLTDSEWFYLVCMSFNFEPGVGLPGQALTKEHHLWLCKANEADSNLFSRALLAQSAGIQTVVCIPLTDGVLELGATELVHEDPKIIQQITNCFIKHVKLACSEQSTSIPQILNRSEKTHQQYSQLANNVPGDTVGLRSSDRSAEGLQVLIQEFDQHEKLFTESGQIESEPVQMEMFYDAKTEYLDESLSDSGLELELLGGDDSMHLLQEPKDDLVSSYSLQTWPSLQKDVSQGLQASDNQPNEVISQSVVNAEASNCSQGSLILGSQQNTKSLQTYLDSAAQKVQEEIALNCNHYSRTLFTILQPQGSHSTVPIISYAKRRNGEFSSKLPYQHAFVKWTKKGNKFTKKKKKSTSQWMLKRVLLNISQLHKKCRDDLSHVTGNRENGNMVMLCRHDEFANNHVQAERRRREKLNERFLVLQSLLPFVTKGNKASILGDTIRYVKELQMHIQHLEEQNKQHEAKFTAKELNEQKQLDIETNISKHNAERGHQKKHELPRMAERKTLIHEGSEPSEMKVVEESTRNLQFSIVKDEALLELQCPWRDGLLLEIIQTLSGLRLETQSVQSSKVNKTCIATLRAKVQEVFRGEKTIIEEIKEALQSLGL